MAAYLRFGHQIQNLFQHSVPYQLPLDVATSSKVGFYDPILIAYRVLSLNIRMPLPALNKRCLRQIAASKIYRKKIIPCALGISTRRLTTRWIRFVPRGALQRTVQSWSPRRCCCLDTFTQGRMSRTVAGQAGGGAILRTIPTGCYDGFGFAVKTATPVPTICRCCYQIIWRSCPQSKR